jgi:succinate dehydrogenase hydrophobic membrane anchor protein
MAMQRLTAIAFIPLSLYLAASVLSLATSDRKTAADWLSLPVPVFVAILVVLAGITHALIGLRSVILDYVHTRTRSWQPRFSHRSSNPCKSSAVRHGRPYQGVWPKARSRRPTFVPPATETGCRGARLETYE